MEQENYISIFTNFLADQLEKEKITLPIVVGLVKDFEPICETVTSRTQLIAFLEKYLNQHPQLAELKINLENPKYIFKNNEA